MPVDWEQFESDVDAIISEAADRTDDRLAGRISSVSRLTNDEIQELFPDPADARKLAELMAIVKSAEDRNEKINRIVANAEKFGGIVVSLLEKFG